MRSILAQAFLTLGLSGLLTSCGDAENQAATTAPATPKSAAKVAPLQVNMLLELSGGMKGFMPVTTAAQQPTAFQQLVSQLASRTHSSPAVGAAQFWLVRKDAPATVPYAHFRDVVQGDTREAALGTELPTMLEQTLALPGASDKVNVLVSDFIYGPDKQSDVALMNVRITDALATITKKQLAVAVLGETSRFAGTYFPAVKTPRRQVALKGETLPYYLWVLGPPAAVGRYLNEVLPASSSAAQQACFGLNFKQIPYAAVLTQVAAGGPLAPSGNGSISYAGAQASTSLEVSDAQEGVDFTVALNLSQLPAAWREPAFLAQNLRVSLPGGAVQLAPNSVRALGGMPGLEGYTHTLRLHLSALPKGGATLTLTLPAPGVPTWVSRWSTENDNQPGAQPRTYRLQEILNGVRAAFPEQLPPVFTATFTLSAS
ncbi:MAG: hypothetical protein ACRYFK_07000 [Janthinobacterium lividum]